MTDPIFLDTETTGLDDDAQVVEIAIVDQTGSVIFQSYCRPTVPVEPEAQAVHRIGADQLVDAPAWPEIADQVKTALAGKPVVIFNADFDVRILHQTASAHGDPADWVKELQTRCAMYRAVKVYGSTNRYGTISLVNAAAEAGIAFQGKAHTAAGDAATTAALWKKMDQIEHRRAADRARRERNAAKQRAADAMPNRLNKPEREAIEKLHEMTAAILAGKTCDIDDTQLRRLKKMGFDLKLVPAKHVKLTVRGKGAAFTRYIGHTAPRYLQGTPYRAFMPWQIKEGTKG